MILINGSFLLNNVTGVERYSTEIIKEFGKLGLSKDKILLVVPQKIPALNQFSIPTLIDDWPFKGKRWIWEQFRLPMLLRKYNNYVLWSPANTGPLIIKDQVVTIHDAAVFEEGKWFSYPNRIYYKNLLPYLANKVHHVATVSNFSKSELITHGLAKENNISVIYNSVSNEFSRQAHYKKNSNEPYFVSLGSRDPRKNIATLVDAWRILSDEYGLNLKLKIIGGGNSGFKPEKINSISDNISFLGYLPDDQMIELLTNARALIYPSIYEGFGLPPLEAMAVETPVLCSNISVFKEVCGSAPIYFDPSNPVKIAKSISDFSKKNSDDIEKMKAAGLSEVSKFSWEKSAKEMITLLQKFSYE